MLVLNVCSHCSSEMSSSVSGVVGGIVDQNGEPAKFLHDLFDGAATEVGIGDIARNLQRFVTVTCNLLAGLRRVRLLLIEIHERDIGALARERHGNGPPDTGVATGYQCHFALELGGGTVIFRLVAWLRVH